MASEFDKIKNLAGWRAKLDELLQAARAAAQDDDLDARLEVADRLTEFIVNNPPALTDDLATAEYADMDRVAKDAHDALLLVTIQERVAGIMSKTAELAALRKQIEGRAAANREAAASIRLEKARRVVAATTDAVTAMLDLKREIERAADSGIQDADLVALGKQLDVLIGSTQTLRSDVESIL
jgi:hypothetical protein